MNTIEREARRMNIFRRIMSIDSETSLQKIEKLLEDEEKNAENLIGLHSTESAATTDSDLSRAITGEELLRRIKPRLENLSRR